MLTYWTYTWELSVLLFITLTELIVLVLFLFCYSVFSFRAANMDTGEDQNTNTGTTSGNPQTSGNSRAPQIAHMSLYERQAVQVRPCLLSCDKITSLGILNHIKKSHIKLKNTQKGSFINQNKL